MRDLIKESDEVKINSNLDRLMDEENFTQFLHQPSLFKLDDMY